MKKEYNKTSDCFNINITRINGYKAGEKIYGHIYITVFPNGKIYIGQSERAINSKEEKGYFGSGVNYRKAMKKYGKKNLKKTILQLCYDFEDYNLQEERLIAVFKATNPERGYNILPGSANLKCGGVNPAKLKNVKRKISISLKKFYKTERGLAIIEMIRENSKITSTGRVGSMLNKKHSENTKTKMSQSQKKRYLDHPEWKTYYSILFMGKRNPFYKRKHTDATKQKISEKNKGHESWCKGIKLSETDEYKWIFEEHSEFMKGNQYAKYKVGQNKRRGRIFSDEEKQAASIRMKNKIVNDKEFKQKLLKNLKQYNE